MYIYNTYISDCRSLDPMNLENRSLGQALRLGLAAILAQALRLARTIVLSAALVALGPALPSFLPACIGAMAPHLKDTELDFIMSQSEKGKNPDEIRALLQTRRAKRGEHAPHVTNIRKAIKAKTFQRGKKETRGRKRKYSTKCVTKMETTRKALLKKTNSNREVRWADVQKKARAPKGHRTTVARAFKRENLNVGRRPPRSKPLRTPPQVKARKKYRSLQGPVAFLLGPPHN